MTRETEAAHLSRPPNSPNLLLGFFRIYDNLVMLYLRVYQI
jgi:hypothetical protein